MNEIIQMLILIILGLLGITKFQAWKTKDLKKEAQKAQNVVQQKEKEIVKLNEVQQKINTINEEQPPAKIAPPDIGDVSSRLDRLNKLHERANKRSQ